MYMHTRPPRLPISHCFNSLLVCVLMNFVSHSLHAPWDYQILWCLRLTLFSLLPAPWDYWILQCLGLILFLLLPALWDYQIHKCLRFIVVLAPSCSMRLITEPANVLDWFCSCSCSVRFAKSTNVSDWSILFLFYQLSQCWCSHHIWEISVLRESIVMIVNWNCSCFVVCPSAKASLVWCQCSCEVLDPCCSRSAHLCRKS